MSTLLVSLLSLSLSHIHTRTFFVFRCTESSTTIVYTYLWAGVWFDWTRMSPIFPYCSLLTFAHCYLICFHPVIFSKYSTLDPFYYSLLKANLYHINYCSLLSLFIWYSFSSNVCLTLTCFPPFAHVTSQKSLCCVLDLVVTLWKIT